MSLFLLAAPSAAPLPRGTLAASGPHVVGTISLPGAQPVALAVYERGNKLFVADDATGNLLMIDGATRRVVSSVPVGREAFALVVNEKFGKVYVASNSREGGTGLISVIGANTGALVTRIDPAAGDPFRASDLRLVGDDGHGKVYVSLFCAFCPRLGVIDVAADQFTPVPTTEKVFFGYGDGLKGVNTVTNEAFAVGGGSLFVIHGDTLKVESSQLPHDGPTDVAVNDVNNKLYLFLEPIGAWSGLLILDRKTGTYKSVVHPNREGTEPLVFNGRTDTLFSGATVNGTRGLIVDGATDRLTYVNLGDGGMDAGAVRSSTDNAYFASEEKTFVVNGSSKLVQTLATGHRTGGGFVQTSAAIDQTRGLVYIVNNYRDGRITVIQDGVIQAEQCVVPNVKGKVLAAARGAIAKASCRTGTIRRVYSAKVKAGRVISQSPASGTRLAKGGKVNLVVSRGKRKPR